jgi:hypothetical protein
MEIVPVEIFVRLLPNGDDEKKLACAIKIEQAIEELLGITPGSPFHEESVFTHFPQDQINKDLLTAKFPVSVHILTPELIDSDLYHSIKRKVLDYVGELLYLIGGTTACRKVLVSRVMTSASQLYSFEPEDQ